MALPSPTRSAVVAVGLAMLLGGCSAATADQAAPPASASPTADAGFPEGPGPQDRPDPALSGQPVPTLPPGDPGTGSDADAGDAGTGDDHTDDHDDRGRVASVPESALVDAETVAALAGGAWTVHPDSGGSCSAATPADATASRTLTLRSDDGWLTQTVSALESAADARAAVAKLARQLARCGFADAGDPRLGEASAQLTKDSASGRELALVVAAEGATVVLLGGGSAAGQSAWPSLADVSLGTACAAGLHGCH
jgi:hypothetical protein